MAIGMAQKVPESELPIKPEVSIDPADLNLIRQISPKLAAKTEGSKELCKFLRNLLLFN